VIAQDWYQQGMREVRQAHYSEALVDSISAGGRSIAPQGLEMMKETYAKLKAILLSSLAVVLACTFARAIDMTGGTTTK